MRQVHLEKITKANASDIINLKVKKEQKRIRSL